MRTVKTTGTGTVSVAPDAAIVRVATVARAAKVAEAFDAVNAAMAEVISVAQRHTEPEQIRAADINLWPWHGNDGAPQGFEARRSATVQCADLRAAQDVLAELVAEVGDALQLEGIELSVSDRAAAMTQAREQAFQVARATAAELATLSGAALGEVRAVELDSPVSGREVAYGAKADLASAVFAPGQSDLSATVTVTWALV